MLNKILKMLKATVSSLIVAFLFVIIVCIGYKFTVKEKVETVAGIVQMLAINPNLKTLEPVLQDGLLIHRPIIGTKYATCKIPSIDVDLPIYYSKSLSHLKYGMGHHPESYFPGEGGSIVYMGHNYKTFLKRLPEVKIGDFIQIETDYGTFEYTVYDTKIVDDTDVSAVPLQDEEEILMIYTCYPTNGLGHATQRFIVYAK